MAQLMTRYFCLSRIRFVALFALVALFADASYAVTRKKRRNLHRRTATAVRLTAKRAVRPARVTMVKAALPRPARAAATAAPIVRGGPWTEPTYADSTLGDNVDGEDLEVRRAAVEALGQYNGSVLVVDTGTGRILSMVNQKLALGSGFQPCSTIKVSVALAALSEKVIESGVTRLRTAGR